MLCKVLEEQKWNVHLDSISEELFTLLLQDVSKLHENEFVSQRNMNEEELNNVHEIIISFLKQSAAENKANFMNERTTIADIYAAMWSNSRYISSLVYLFTSTPREIKMHIFECWTATEAHQSTTFERSCQVHFLTLFCRVESEFVALRQ